jgi:GT2 family glycosyltransferase
MIDNRHTSENQNFSFCVVLYKSGDVLGSMMSSLLPHLKDDDEIIFLDNFPASDDHILVDELRDKSSAPVHYFSSAENVGFARACNEIAGKASKQRLIFLNPDTTTEQFDRSSHKKNCLVGPLIFNINGERQSSSGTSRTIWDEFKMRWLRRFEIHNSQDEIAYVSGAALSIDKIAFDALGGFDEEFFMYFEDIDLCFRARDIGMRIEISDTWRVGHVGGSAAKKIRTVSELRSLRSALIFYEKWNQNVRVYKSLILLDSVARLFAYLARREIANMRSQVVIIMKLLRGIH